MTQILIHILSIGNQFISDAGFDVLAMVQSSCDHDSVELLRARLPDPALLAYL